MDKKPKILRTSQLETVLRISQAVTRTLDLEEILDMACRMTAQALKADRCSIGLLSTKDTYEIVDSYRKKLSYPSIDGAKFNLKNYPNIALFLLKGKAVHLFDHKKIPLSLKEKELFKQLNIKVFLAVPIFIERKPLGAFHLSRVEDSSPFFSSDIYLCQTIANQVGIAIKTATLLKDLKERFEQQNIILDISKSLFKTLNLQELFNLITQKACEALKMERCTISTFEPGQKQGVIRAIYLSREAGVLGKGIRNATYLGRKYTISDFSYIYKMLQRKKIFVAEDIFSTPLTFRARKYIKEIRVKSTLIVPFFSERKMSGILQASTIKNHHKFTDSEIKLCQTIANLASLALENAKLMQDLQEKSEKIQKQTGDLERKFKEENALLEISKALSQTLDLKKLFKIVTRKTSELLGIERCAAMLIDENKRSILFYTAFSRGKYEPESEDVPRRIEDFPTMMNQVEKNHIFCTSDISQSELSSKEKNYFKKRGVKAVLNVPFVLKNRILGILALNPLKEQHKFTDSEIKLCQAIANQLSLAIENARLMELTKNHAKELEGLALKIINAQEEERKSIAGKLHDVIAQDLTALQFDLKMSQQSLPQGYAQIGERLKQSEELVRQSLDNLRNLTSDLRPPVLDDFGLSCAIRWYVDDFRRRTNLKIDLKIPESVCKFTPEFETTIYRIIQEGLTNVVKHSKASKVSISLQKKRDFARIIMKDNGTGFDVKSSYSSGGFGLFRLKENAELLGGKFKINSKKGRGTKLDITLPC